MCLKVLPHQVKDFNENLVPERIQNLVTLFAAADDLPAAQDCQMLRNIGLLGAQPFLNGAGGISPSRRTSSMAIRVG